MPISPNALAIIGIVASFSAVIAALVSGIFVLVNGHITNKKTTEIEQLKSELSGEIERLKAQLGHGQVVSTTQWNAEFNGYQALWKSMIPLRSIAQKIVTRERDLAQLGLEAGDVAETNQLVNKKKLLDKYTVAITDCMHAINEHAPFYDPDVRKTSNEVHGLAVGIFKSHTAAMVQVIKKQYPTEEEGTDRDREGREALIKLMARMDNVEEMIRTRLSAVQVIN
jgi:hypothetical protein